MLYEGPAALKKSHKEKLKTRFKKCQNFNEVTVFINLSKSSILERLIDLLIIEESLKLFGLELISLKTKRMTYMKTKFCQ